MQDDIYVYKLQDSYSIISNRRNIKQSSSYYQRRYYPSSNDKSKWRIDHDQVDKANNKEDKDRRDAVVQVLSSVANLVYKQQQWLTNHWLVNDNVNDEMRGIYSWFSCQDNSQTDRRIMCKESKKRSMNQAKGMDQNQYTCCPMLSQLMKSTAPCSNLYRSSF